MKVTTEKAPESQIIISIEVEPTELEKALDGSYRRLVNRANIPGFRKGKAPRAIVERFFGPQALLEDAIDQIAPKMTREAIASENVPAISDPRIEVTQLDPVIIKATVDVTPEIDLGDYQAIRVEPETAEVSDEDVEKSIDRIREREASWVPVERPVENEDRVVIDFVGQSEGEPDYSQTGIEYLVITGRRDPAPGFADQLIGVEAGATKEFVLTFEEDFEDELFKGKTFNFSATVHSIKGKRLPELDDEFAQSVGEEFPTVAALRERVTADLKSHAERIAAEKTRDKALEGLVECATLEVPYGMTDREIHSMIEERERLLAQQGIRFEDYLRITGKTGDSLHAEFKDEAQLRVKRRLLLTKLAETENLEVTADEINNEITEMVQESGEGAARIMQLLEQPSARLVIAQNMLVRKGMAKLVEIATEGKMTFPIFPEEQEEVSDTDVEEA